MAKRKKAEGNGSLALDTTAEPKPETIPQTKVGLLRQEEILERGTVESIRALRTIRQEKLHRFAEGHWEYNTSFDRYVQERWHRTRQWATQEIQWLEVCEHVEAWFGKSIYHFSHSHTRVLRKLMPYPEIFTAALQEINGLAVRSDFYIKEVAKRRIRFVKMMDEWNLRREEEPKLQYKEFIALDLLEGGSRRPAELYEAKKKAAESGRSLKDCLVEACRASGQYVPGWKDLL